MRVPYLAAMLLLSACAHSPRDNVSASPWDRECYPGFEADVVVLAGVDSENCGILPRQDASSASAAESCLRKAIPTTGAFRVAHASQGDDSLFCDAAMRDASGVYWSVFHDFDVTGQMGSSGKNAALWVSRCTGIALEPGTIGPGSFFHLVGCQEDRDALERVLGARQDGSN